MGEEESCSDCEEGATNGSSAVEEVDIGERRGDSRERRENVERQEGKCFFVWQEEHSRNQM